MPQAAKAKTSKAKNNKSDYEVAREKNMEENRARLVALGLEDAAKELQGKNKHSIPQVRTQIQLLETGQWTQHR